MKFIYTILGLASIMIAGCEPSPRYEMPGPMLEDTNNTLEEVRQKYTTPQEVKRDTKIFPDKFGNDTWIKGPSMMRSTFQTSYYLQAHYHNNEIRSYQLIVFQIRPDNIGPAYFREAWDAKGNRFEITPADPPHMLQRWSADEFVSVRIPEDYLQISQNTGMELQLLGWHDILYIRVEGFYIKGFLEKANEHL